MTPPLYVMNPPPSSPFPLVESSKEDHHQVLLQLPFAPQQQQLPAAASSDLSFYISLTYSNQQDQRGTISTNPAELQVYDHEHKTEKCSYPNHHGGSSSTDQLQAFSSSSTDPLPHMNVNDGDHSKDRYDQNGSADIDHSSNGSKWMSSKMRLMQKIKNNSNSKPAARIVQGSQQKDNNISNGQKINSPNNSSSSSSSTTTTTRVCSDCHTTKTPLWRSGPQGPKSLCNACGIRQRKARRAAMAAAAAAEGAVHAGDRILSMPVVTNKHKVVQKKEKRSSRKRNNERFKKQIHCRGSKELVFDNFALSLSKNSAFRRVFPRDEEEAAVLLMALSCGLA